MQSIRNIAIIAHVDHGKTTLVDKIIDQAKILDVRKERTDLLLDNNDLEKIQEEIRAYNKIKKEVTQQKNCTFINITKTSRKAKYKKKYVAEDNLHFSGSMHELWVAEIIKKMNLDLSN